VATVHCAGAGSVQPSFRKLQNLLQNVCNVVRYLAARCDHLQLSFRKLKSKPTCHSIIISDRQVKLLGQLEISLTYKRS
jgi:hypothetical protein